MDKKKLTAEEQANHDANQMSHQAQADVDRKKNLVDLDSYQPEPAVDAPPAEPVKPAPAKTHAPKPKSKTAKRKR